MSIPAADWPAKLDGANVRVTRVIGLITDARRGLDLAMAGIQRVAFLDDGRPITDPKGPAILPRPDEARRAKTEMAQRIGRVLDDLAWIDNTATEYRRLGVEFYRDDAGRIIVVNPVKLPTSDEKKIAAEEALEENWCRSCQRVEHFTLAGDGGLCNTCADLLAVCMAIDPKSKAILPPEPLVKLRAEGKRIYDVDYRAAMATRKRKLKKP